MAKKKEEPVVDNETGKIKVKEKQKVQSTGNETKGNVTKVKEKLMQLEFQYNMQLKQLEAKTKSATQLLTENRKDDRTKMQASQQSELIDQRLNKKPPKKFESSGNDIMSGEFGLGAFGPK